MRVLSKLKNEFFSWLELIICVWPETSIGYKLRRFYWTKKFDLKFFPHFGRMTRIYGNKSNLFIGERFCCGEYVEINFCTSKGIYIGNDILMARGVYLRAGNHKFDRLDIPVNQQGHDAAVISHNGKEYSIVIEDNVWIGANVTILSGAKIGAGSIIAAGSVVPKVEFPPGSIVGGVPARIIKNRMETNK